MVCNFAHKNKIRRTRGRFILYLKRSLSKTTELILTKFGRIHTDI